MTHPPGTVSDRIALLIVHLQPDIIRPEGAFGAMFAAEVKRRGVMDHVNQAIRIVRDTGGVVVAARVAFAEDYSDARSPIPLLQAARDAQALRDGTWGAAIDPAVQLHAEDLVLTHTRPGPFTGTRLEKWLREQGVTRVVVCGVATNVSVEAAVRQAADLDFETVVLTDACSAADTAAHEASIKSMSAFAFVQDLNQFHELPRG